MQMKRCSFSSLAMTEIAKLNFFYRSPCHCDRLPDADGEAHGLQELPRQEPGGRRNFGLHVDHLLGQDRNSDPEPDDRCSHVVRQSG